MSRETVTAGPPVASLGSAHDALLILDVDEVILEFIGPFRRLLAEYGAHLSPESFRLTGNVRSLSTGAALTGHELDGITAKLFEEQDQRQPLVAGVAEALARLSGAADIVFLTAMTPSFYPLRRGLLDRNGLHFPMIATERSKGAVVAELAERWAGPLVFADDLPPNLETVRRSAPDVHLLHLMADEAFRPHLPPLPAGAVSAADWPEAEAIIAGWLGCDGRG
ncbi:hypothetical protein [Aurantimonas sp. VKM B-3413]|uniref:hypothetical protein n=1 Tax=Aurantimonas sp. VKM B-3413 TaxID=2779401 RepID=UPI001E3C949F|nr:hypothetical protein [Aurantimonas sp. VKM B-3413]MCB8838484.1 hypothetical protein [Aurantimonas sp. VKM B-3413]